MIKVKNNPRAEIEQWAFVKCLCQTSQSVRNRYEIALWQHRHSFSLFFSFNALFCMNKCLPPHEYSFIVEIYSLLLIDVHLKYLYLRGPNVQVVMWLTSTHSCLDITVKWRWMCNTTRTTKDKHSSHASSDCANQTRETRRATLQHSIYLYIH